jgi:hypothetical protein
MADNTEDKKPGKSSTKAAQKPAQNAGLGLEGRPFEPPSLSCGPGGRFWRSARIGAGAD